MQSGKNIKYLLIVFVIAFVARIFFTIFVYEPFSKKYFPEWAHPSGKFDWGSDDKYDEIANNLIDGNGFVEFGGTDSRLYPNLSRTPVYPLVLAAQFYLFGDGFWINVVINIIYQCLASIVLYYIVMLLFDKEKIAFVSSVIWALYPLPMLQAMGPHTEAFYELILALFAYFLYKFYKSKRTSHLIVFSLLLTVLTLTRPISLLFPLYFAGILIVCKGCSLNAKIKQILILFAIFIIGITPWVYRGYKITGEILPLVTYKKPINYYIVKKVYPKELQTGATANFADEIKYPLVFVKKLMSRLISFWYKGHSKMVNTVNAIFQFPFLFFVVLGIWRARKQGVFIFPILIIVIYFWLMYSIIHAISRYSFPMVMLLCPFVAIVVVEFMLRFNAGLGISSGSKSTDIKA